MSITNWLLWLCLLLLAAYVAFVAYKLLHEMRFRKKPYIALAELAWQSLAPAPTDELLQEVLLVGDFGNVAPDGNDSVLLALRQHLASAAPGTAVVFLGDNVYPVGLPAEDHRLRETAEKKLNHQIGLFLENQQLRPFFLSGNHDWNKGRAGGLEQVLRQQAFVTERLGPVYLPAGGCPGPRLVELHPQIALIVINTQWWVQRGERPLGKEAGCSVETEEEFFEQLRQLIEQNAHRHILIAAHHPLYSNALHGGKHTIKHHVFPLTAAHKKLYIPFPVAGSLYPLYRRIFGAYEDMSHPRYKRMRKKLLRLFRDYKHLVYAAGHDHNLQHFRRKDNHYIVSGSASKTSYVRRGGKAAFTHEHLGYFSVRYYASGQVWLFAHEPDPEKKDGTADIVYHCRLDEDRLAKT